MGLGPWSFTTEHKKCRKILGEAHQFLLKKKWHKSMEKAKVPFFLYTYLGEIPSAALGGSRRLSAAVGGSRRNPTYTPQIFIGGCRRLSAALGGSRRLSAV